MRMSKEPVSIATNQRNQTDQKRGHCWEASFRSQRLLDEAAVLACLAYVELTSIRAKLAIKPKDSTYAPLANRIGRFEEKLRLQLLKLDW